MAVQMRVILFLVFMTGFQLATSNGQNSTQDPCFGGGPCSQICRVVNGTAQCSCSENFLLRPPENTVCVYKHPCDQNPSECSPLVCRREYGINSYTCWCSPNFILVYNSSISATTCLPVNGATGVDPCYRCSHSCVIVNGVSKCSCPGGYNLQPPEYTQCVANSTALEFCSRCSSSGCINVNGIARCDCPHGFELLPPENTTCVDVDECTRSNPCPYPYSCENTVGDYNCFCGPGFCNNCNEAGTCIDVNECWRAENGYDSSVCPDNATCTNTDGSYRCDCNEGFTMVNGSCQSCSICPSSQSQSPSITAHTHDVDATRRLPEGQSPSLTTNTHMGATNVPLITSEETIGIIVGVVVSLIVLILMVLVLISIYICVSRGGGVRAAWRKNHTYTAMSVQKSSPEATYVQLSH